MKNFILHRYLPILIGLLSFTAIGKAQFWEVEVSSVGGIVLSGTFEEVQNRIFLTINNPTGSQQEVHINLLIEGNNGIRFSSESVYLMGSLVLNPGLNMLNIGQIVNGYQSVTLEDLEASNNISPEVRNYMIRQRRLPPGNYQVCARVYTAATATSPIREVTQTPACQTFQVPLTERPIIITPAEGSNNSVWLSWENAQNLQIVWQHNRFGQDISYTVEIKKFINIEEMYDFHNHTRPNDRFNSMQEGVRTSPPLLNTNVHVFNALDHTLNLDVGDWIAIRVSAELEGAQFENDGYSNILICAVGIDPALFCEHPNLNVSAVWPVAGDTVPFRDVHYIVRFDPLCDNLRAFNTTFRTRSSEGIVVEQFEARNTWRPQGPLGFLINFARRNPTYPESWLVSDNSFAQHLPLIHRPFNSDAAPALLHPREGGYRMSAEYNFTYYDSHLRRESNRQVVETAYYGRSYFTGMPTPRLNVPVNDANYRPGEPITFDFRAGQPPSQVLPHFQIIRIRGNQADNPYLNVREKMVFQVSRSQNFEPDQIIVSQLRKIEVNSSHPGARPADFENPSFVGLEEVQSRPLPQLPGRTYDVSTFNERVFPQINYQHTFDDEGTLWWRVVWLRNPENFNEISPSGITEDMIYHASEVRRLVITNNPTDGGGDGTPPRDITTIPRNTPTRCETGCDPGDPSNTTTMTDVSSVTNIKVGYFAVTDIERANTSSAGVINGTGVVSIDFLWDLKVRVALNNVRINTDRELISGDVKTVVDIDTSFMNNITEALNTAGAGETLKNIVTQGNGTRLISEALQREPMGMPIAFHRQIGDNNHDVLIGVTEMVFTKNGATMKLLYEHKFDALGPERYITLRGNICMKPSGFGPNVIIALNRDFALGNPSSDDPSGTQNLKVRGHSGSIDDVRANATYIEFHCACVKGLAIRLEIDLNKEKYIKANPTDGDSTVSVQFGFHLDASVHCDPEAVPRGLNVRDIKTKDNFMMTASMDEFMLKDVDGWRFKPGTLTIDASDIANPSGLSFPPGYEHSAIIENNPAIPGLRESTLNTWKGIHISEMTLMPPKELVDSEADSDPETRPSFRFNNVIIDNTGLTFNIDARDLLDESTGNAGGWAFSIDILRMRVIQFVPRELSMTGKIGLPIQKEGEFMIYNAIFCFTPRSGDRQRSAGFVMNVNLDSELKMPAMMGRAVLNNNSYIAFKFGSVAEETMSTFSAEQRAEILQSRIALFVAGNITFSSDENEGEDNQLNTSMNFRGINFELGYSTRRGFYRHQFNRASPQKFVGSYTFSDEEDGEQKTASGFPITLGSINLRSRFETQEGEEICIGADLTIPITVNFSGDDEGGLGGSVTISIPMEYNTSTKRFRLNRPTVDRIAINGEMSGIKLEGSIEFYRNAERCTHTATGARGHIKATLPMAEVTLAAEFGSTIASDPAESFRYFYVDGKVLFNTGITLGPLQLLGLGGGFYYNMSVTGADNTYRPEDMSAVTSMHNDMDDPGNKSAAVLSDAEAANKPFPETPASGNNPCPSKGTMAFKLLIPIAMAGEPSAFNMDISITAQFESGEGLSLLEIKGDGYIMAEIKKRNEAPIKLDVAILFQNTTERQEFTTKIDFYLDYPSLNPSSTALLVIKGNEKKRAFDRLERSVFACLDIHLSRPVIGTTPNGNKIFGSGTYYFKLGSPQNPSGGRIKLLDILEVQLNMYLQAGMDLDAGFMELPERVSRILYGGTNETSGEGGNLAGDEASQDALSPSRPIESPSTISGFKTGVSADVEINLDMFLIYAELGLAFGFDLEIAKRSGVFCMIDGVPTPMGLDGWYTTGSVYAAIEGEIGFQIKLIRQRRFSLLSLGAAFILQGGFPTPAWVEGRAAVYYSLLNGLISGRSEIKLSAGTRCVPPRTNPFGFPVIDQVIPEDNSERVSPFYEPEVSYVVPIGETLTIPVLDISGNHVSTDYVRAIIPSDGFQIIENGQAINLRHRMQGNKRAVVERLSSNLRNDGRSVTNAKFTVRVQAEERVNGAWTLAVFPQEDINEDGELVLHPLRGRTWYEEIVHDFTIDTIPRRIPADRLHASMPVKNQRYHLRQAPYANHYYLEFRPGVFVNHYFYTQRDGKTYDYIVRFQDYSGGAPIDIPTSGINQGILSGRTFVSLSTKPHLRNSTYYSVSVIRRDITPAPDASASQGTGILPGFNIGTSSLSGNVSLPDHLIQQIQASYQANFLGTMQSYTLDVVLNRLSQQLQPGREQSRREVVVYQYNFRTSHYNTLQEKLATCTTTLNGNIVTVTGNERFDRADLYSYIYNPAGSFNSSGVFVKRPLIGIYPDRNNPVYNRMTMNTTWSSNNFSYRDYQVLLDHFLRNWGSRLNWSPSAGPERGRFFTYSNNLVTGSWFFNRADANYQPTQQLFHSTGLRRLENFNNLNFRFNGIAVRENIHQRRFVVILSQHVDGPISDAEAQASWDDYIQSHSQSTPGAITYGGGGLTNAHLVTGPVLSYIFDLGLMAQQDINRVYTNVNGLFLQIATTGSMNAGEFTNRYGIFPWANGQHMTNVWQLGSNSYLNSRFPSFNLNFLNAFRTFNNNRASNFSLQNLPGRYNFTITETGAETQDARSANPANNLGRTLFFQVN